MTSKTKLLLVEDDKHIIQFIRTVLEGNDYRVTDALLGQEALSLTASLCPDVILLDLGLPDIDGCDVIRQIRSFSQVPIIVISARSQEQDKVYALDLGADDYMTKPFGTNELMARIRTALRRSRVIAPDHVYRAMNLEINFARRQIFLSGKDIHLTQIEYQLLTLLAENSGKVLTYRYLMRTIWGPYTNDNNQILRVNMANIRRKIEQNPTSPEYLFTEIGVGYRLLADENI